MQFHRVLSVTLFSAIGLALLASPLPSIHEDEPQRKAEQSKTTSRKPQLKLQKVDLGAATDVALPSSQVALKAVSYRTPDGRSGWVLRVTVTA